MSMQLTVYVGPFLLCKRNPEVHADAYELTNGRLADLRGELSGDDPNVKYIGPNVAIPGIERQLRFDRHRDAVVLSDIVPHTAVGIFVEQFYDDIKVLRLNYESVSVEWGVVPGYF